MCVCFVKHPVQKPKLLSFPSTLSRICFFSTAPFLGPSWGSLQKFILLLIGNRVSCFWVAHLVMHQTPKKLQNESFFASSHQLEQGKSSLSLKARFWTKFVARFWTKMMRPSCQRSPNLTFPKLDNRKSSNKNPSCPAVRLTDYSS